MNLSALPPVEIGDTAGTVRLHRRELDLVRQVVATHGTHASRRVLLVEFVTADGVCGWGECGAPDESGYTGETADAAATFLAGIAPGVIAGRRSLTAASVRALVAAIDPDAASRHPMAVAALETAVLDAQLRTTDTAFESLLGSPPKRAALAGATLGNQGPDVSTAAAVDAVVAEALEAVALGYPRLKLKIGPGLHTTDIVRELRAVLDDGVILLGDANGAYRPDDVAHVASLGELGLDFVEQPFPAHDTTSHQALVATGTIRVALDEGVNGAADALDALVNHECTDITLKPARFGFIACVDVLNRAAEHGAGAWIGGMFDTGVARWANVRLAAHPAVTLASDIGSSARYWATDLTEPIVADAGLVTVPGTRSPGLSGVPLDA